MDIVKNGSHVDSAFLWNWHLSGVVGQVLHSGWIHLAAHLRINIWQLHLIISAVFLDQHPIIAPSPSWSTSLPLWEDHGRGQGEGRPTISLPFVWLEDMGSNCHLSGANMKYGWPLLVSWQCWSLFDEMELFLSGSLMAATCVKPYWEQKKSSGIKHKNENTPLHFSSSA